MLLNYFPLVAYYNTANININNHISQSRFSFSLLVMYCENALFRSDSNERQKNEKKPDTLIPLMAISKTQFPKTLLMLKYIKQSRVVSLIYGIKGVGPQKINKG
jgi:hypothetical protein